MIELLLIWVYLKGSYKLNMSTLFINRGDNLHALEIVPYKF